MEAFSNLRQFLFGVRRRYLKKQRRAVHDVSFAPGLPPGISSETLDEICLDHFDERPRSFAYLHLSGWKPSGAYRLLIQTERGNEIHLVYKESFYTPDHIPALVNLPVRPGPSEYHVFRQPVGALAPYLPQVFLAEELSPSLHYRFLLEDLGPQYHRIYDTNEIYRASEMLPRLHQALCDWTDEIKPHSLIEYGKSVSEALQEYARISFENYSQQANDPAATAVLSCWSRVSQAHLMPEFFGIQLNKPIHGDTNYTNIHIHNQDPFKFKLVDWEWAGYGLPHADLASLLKGMPDDLEKRALRKFFGTARNPNPSLNPELNLVENQRLYYWCQIERAMLDAAFLTNQYLNSVHPAHFSLPDAISRSLLQILSACQKLGV